MIQYSIKYKYKLQRKVILTNISRIQNTEKSILSTSCTQVFQILRKSGYIPYFLWVGILNLLNLHFELINLPKMQFTYSHFGLQIT